MSFNSLDFAIFLPVVFALYWFVFRRNLRLQNLLIVAASYLFYGWWDWRFLSLLFFSSLVDYLVGLGLAEEEDARKRKLLLAASVAVNLGLLGFFKYFNFFAASFADAFTLFGLPIQAASLRVILPVGISFYTFQTMSYSIDCYRRDLKPTRDFVAFMAYVSFFPQLVAGPIERATNLLPQFYEKREFDYEKAMDGARQILWGLFKKIVIADRCAAHANIIFDEWGSFSGSTLALGAVFFAFQIYGDFSGYSDIAIGTSRLFGFRLMRNFAYPYFSRDIAEFWRRWHISLSTWFRDYLYVPLGGSRGGLWQRVRNTFVIFLVSGFWHGANWTFLAWGALNALYFMPLLLSDRNRRNIGIAAAGRILPRPREVLQMAGTFCLTTLGWIFFRAESIGDAFGYIGKILSRSLLTVPFFPDRRGAFGTLLLLAAFAAVEWLGREGEHPLERLASWKSRPLRWIAAYGLAACIYWFGNFGQQIEFIYFQF